MIYVECKQDQVLVQTITGLAPKQIIHDLKGKPGVIGTVSTLNNARAMVDEDPTAVQPAYLSRMTVVQDMDALGLRLLQHAAQGNLVVVLRPRLEEWILRAARDAQVDPARYNLPISAAGLKSEINHGLDRLEKLVAALDDAPRLKALHGLLRL